MHPCLNFQGKPKKYNGKYRNYSREALLKAYEHVTSTGTSVRKTAIQFGIPVQTLRDRVKGIIDPLKVSCGRETVFSHEEELALIEHVEVLAELGYRVPNSKLQQLGGELAYTYGKRPTSKPLSNCWLYPFIKRWSDRIKSVKPSSHDANCAMSSTPVQKLKIINSGKEAVKILLENKLKGVKNDENKNKCSCKCVCKPAVTDITHYENEKENRTAKQKTSLTLSPKPSTSRLNQRQIKMSEHSESEDEEDLTCTNAKSEYEDLTNSESEDEEDLANTESEDEEDLTNDDDLCCICEMFSPPNLNEKPFLKFVSWAQCVQCNHWCHLSFCHQQSVVRRADTFLCPHCR